MQDGEWEGSQMESPAGRSREVLAPDEMCSDFTLKSEEDHGKTPGRGSCSDSRWKVG